MFSLGFWVSGAEHRLLRVWGKRSKPKLSEPGCSVSLRVEVRVPFLRPTKTPTTPLQEQLRSSKLPSLPHFNPKHMRLSQSRTSNPKQKPRISVLHSCLSSALNRKECPAHKAMLSRGLCVLGASARRIPKSNSSLDNDSDEHNSNKQNAENSKPMTP